MVIKYCLLGKVHSSFLSIFLVLHLLIWKIGLCWKKSLLVECIQPGPQANLFCFICSLGSKSPICEMELASCLLCISQERIGRTRFGGCYRLWYCVRMYRGTKGCVQSCLFRPQHEFSSRKKFTCRTQMISALLYY